MPILIDYSQLAISCAVVFPDDMQKGKDTKKMQDIIRHVTLKSISTYNREYNHRYGQLILCCDTGPLWRKGVYPYYKKHRKKNRDESPIDWDTVLSFVSELQTDLETIFPYPVVKAPGAEGDDCIAVLSKYFSTQTSNESENPLDILSNEPPKTLIVSSDHDFKQLHKYKNLKQWSPIQKKWVVNDNPDFLIEKIISGDKGDGVPSVLMDDDWFVNGEGRAKSVTKAVYEKFKNYEDLTEEEKTKYNRNKKLIDFDCIPQEISNNILSSYTNWRKTTKKQDIMNYLIKHRCRELLDKIGDF